MIFYAAFVVNGTQDSLYPLCGGERCAWTSNDIGRTLEN